MHLWTTTPCRRLPSAFLTLGPWHAMTLQQASLTHACGNEEQGLLSLHGQRVEAVILPPFQASFRMRVLSLLLRRGEQEWPWEAVILLLLPASSRRRILSLQLPREVQK